MDKEALEILASVAFAGLGASFVEVIESLV
jgi:hypothetical protein